jgi:hypothetical protein
LLKRYVRYITTAIQTREWLDSPRKPNGGLP